MNVTTQSLIGEGMSQAATICRSNFKVSLGATGLLCGGEEGDGNIRRGLRLTVAVFLSHSPFYFETRFLPEPEAHGWTRPAGQQSQGSCCLFHLSAEITGTHCAQIITGSYHTLWVMGTQSNLGPHACAASFANGDISAAHLFLIKPLKIFIIIFTIVCACVCMHMHV